MLLHGGPHNARDRRLQWRWNAQVFANWGYVTAWHNFHGSSGFGQAWTDSITKDWADLPYQDTIKAAEWFRCAAVDRRRPHGRGRRQLRRLSRLAACSAGRIRSRRWSRTRPCTTRYTQYASDDGASKKRYGEFWEDLERFERNSPHTDRGELQDADAGDSRPARPARAGESRHRAVQHAAEPRRAEQARVLSRTRTTGCSSRRTRCSGTRPSASGWRSTCARARATPRSRVS